MYEVYLDGRILDYPGDIVNCIEDPELNLALNDAGSFEFNIFPSNPEFDNILNRSSMVQVFRDEKEIFCGEVRESGKDFNNIKNVYAVGELSFLFDSIQPQAEYHDLSPRQMLETWVNEHNSQVEDRKKFNIGIVTVHDSNDSLYRYTNRETTLDAIREKLIDKLGGYLRVRKVDGIRYLDYITLADYGKYCSQTIEFGLNLLDYSENTSAADIATAVIPLGARIEEGGEIKALDYYVDITSVNGGLDYVYIPEAVKRFGWVKKVVNWDDVTQPENLKRKGEEWLADNQYEWMTLELTAIDLSDLQSAYENFELGDTVRATAEPYGMDRVFPVQEMTIRLHKPDENKLILGDAAARTLSQQTASIGKNFETQLENTRQTTAWLQSAIDNATAMMTGSKGGYKISEYDENGRWLRDLYMNAPTKEEATLVMQINMNGIGFSRDGFDGPYKNAWTIDGVLLGEFIKAGSVQAEALSAEYKAAVTNEINTTVTASFKVAENLISAEVTRAQGAEEQLASSLKLTDAAITAEVERATQAEGELSSSIQLNAESIKSKVSYNEFGSYVEQYYNRVIIGFNNNSKYVQIGAGNIAIYDSEVANSKMRSVFDQDGNHFYRDGYYVGKIGTNQWKNNTSHKGLVFDLEHGGKYMAWAHRETESSDVYTSIWTFSRNYSIFDAFGLHAGCDIDMHNWTIRNVKLENLSVDNVLGWTGSIPIITSIADNGDGTVRWTYSSIDVKNGIITAGPS